MTTALTPVPLTPDLLMDGDPSHRILTAWIAKEELRKLLATARTGGQQHDIAHRLHRFNSWCAQSGLPELERLAATIEAWWPEVLGFLQTGVTNAGTEATNRAPLPEQQHLLRAPSGWLALAAVRACGR